MATIRVYELAKEMDMNSKDLLDKMQELGLPMKNHMSTIPGKEVNRIKSMVLKHMGDPNAQPIPRPAEKKEKPPLSGLRPPQSVKPAPGPASETTRVPGPAGKPVFGTKPQAPASQPARTAPQGGTPFSGSRPQAGGHPGPARPQQNLGGQPQRQPYQAQPQQPAGGSKPATGYPQGGQKPFGTHGQTTSRPPQAPGQRPQGAASAAGQKYQNYQHPGTAKPQGGAPGTSQTAQQNRRPGGPAEASKGFRGPSPKPPAIRKETADHLSQIVTTHEEDNRFLNKVESAVGDKAYDRGGKTKTPMRKPTRFEDNKGGKQKGRGGFGGKNARMAPKEPVPVVVKNVTLDGPVTVTEFAHLMNRKAADLIKKLFNMGLMATMNQELDMDTLILLGQEFGTTVEARVTKEEILTAADEPDAPELLKERPPVVTIMGHVDHGKTSLLDAIRKANVQASEAGGITQHIGAYQVMINNRKITFLDTPGHEAFTAMRARGAQVTDIAVLVVAADDGVMPQTVEAINHAKAAGVPIIIAVNKIDKEGANPERVKQELTEYGLVCEDWGGDTIFVEVSAKTQQNLDQLLEMILLVADMGDLKANPNRKAKGVVIEAKLDKGRGPVATVLVQNGTLTVGDFVIVGMAQGRIRAMNDERGRTVKKALPSMPVEIIGLSEVPQAGDIFQVVEDERLAKQIASERTAVKREEAIHARTRISLDDLFRQIKTGEVKDLNIIIKADVQGSIEALKQSLEKLSNDEVRVNIIHQGVGGITETDVDFAAASSAIILGFNVRPDVNARRTAEAQQVDIRLYRVIYNAIEDVKSAMSGLLKPEIREVVLGRAEVRQVIHVPKVGYVAGSYVLEGKITRNCQCRVIRDNIVIHEGDLASLRRFKDDVKEVAAGYECGISLERFNDIREGDQIEAFILEEIKREIS
jgi:translation initiation factor IF-2